MQGPLGQHPAGQQAEGEGMWARASLWCNQRPREEEILQKPGESNQGKVRKVLLKCGGS